MSINEKASRDSIQYPISAYKPSDPASGSPAAEKAAEDVRAYWQYQHDLVGPSSPSSTPWRPVWQSIALAPFLLPSLFAYYRPGTLGSLDGALGWRMWSATPRRVPSFFSPDRAPEDDWVPDGLTRPWAHSPPLPSDPLFHRGAAHPHKADMDRYYFLHWDKVLLQHRRPLYAIPWHYGPLLRKTIRMAGTSGTMADMDEMWEMTTRAIIMGEPPMRYFESLAAISSAASESRESMEPMIGAEKEVDAVDGAERKLVPGIPVAEAYGEWPGKEEDAEKARTERESADLDAGSKMW